VAPPHNADITIATIQMPPSAACRFGIAEIDEDYRITGFEEKPQHGNPAPSRFDPNMVSVSMGIYLFETKVLLDALHEDSQAADSAHDFGKDVSSRGF
jgi:glucose-1-phosphate adenylyltransferase